MPELPDNVVDDILCRLPVKDLLQFRCVSKQWRALIDSPFFIKLQLNQSLQALTHLTLISGYYKLSLVDFDVVDGIVKLGPSVQVYSPLKNWTNISFSCIGLVCFYNILDHRAMSLLNPSTKDYKILPQLPAHDDLDPTFVGLVYDHVHDEIKVFWIWFDELDSFVTQVWVCGLRSNKWSRVCEGFKYYLYLSNGSERNAGVLVNGALHWLACRYRVGLFDVVVGFDGVDEIYREAKVPSVCNVSYGTLGVLGGCLCLLYAFNEGDDVELWVMNDYMVDGSWTKLTRITFTYSKLHSLLCARVLGCSKSSRDGVLLQVCGNVIWYDVKGKRVFDLGIRSFVADVYVKSLVKLNHYQ